MNKNDLRYKKTHAAIRRTFEQMVIETDYQKITITDLCRRAEINRKTFYLHYAALDDLLLEYADEFAFRATDYFLQYLDEGNAPSIEGICSVFEKLLHEKYDFSIKIICGMGDTSFMEKAERAFLAHGTQFFHNRAGFTEEELFLAFDSLINAILWAYKVSYAKKMELSSQQLTKILTRILNIDDLM